MHCEHSGAVVSISNAALAVSRLANCSAAVHVQSWFCGTTYNSTLTSQEDIIVGSSPQLRSAATIREVEVSGTKLQIAPKLRSHSVTTDSHLRFNCHARNIARTCYHTLPMICVQSTV